ncbi:MAG: hypothetical protein AAB482_02940 [Patescibacteria group bacterium]
MKKYSIFFIGSLAIITIHRYFALRHWYVRVWWLDITLHAIAVLFLVILYYIFAPKRSFLGLCIFVMAIGATWEVFEFFFNGSLFGVEDARLNNPIWVLDTIKDLIVDFTAGILWWQVISSYNKRNV